MQPAAHLPIVRHFLACDKVEWSADRRSISLINLVTSVSPAPGEEFPIRREELWLYSVLADSRGAFQFSFELWLLTLEEEELIFRRGPTTVELGKNPLTIHGMPARMANVTLARPGLYEFRLICDGNVLAREPVVVRERP
jgi:hypothetical protein